MMTSRRDENIKITPKSKKILNQILLENPKLGKILQESVDVETARENIKNWVSEELQKEPLAYQFYKSEITGRKNFEQISWPSIAAIRILDYIDYAEMEYTDLNLRGKKGQNHPFRTLWLAVKHGTGAGRSAFFKDMLHLFRQFNGTQSKEIPTKEKLTEWMDRHPVGTQKDIVTLRETNKKRIIDVLIRKIEDGTFSTKKYSLNQFSSYEEKFEQMLKWWDTHQFHLKFAIRTPDLLNEMLNFSLSDKKMDVLHKAEQAGIPFFINPYYLSLLNVEEPEGYIASDMAVYNYIFYSQELIEEFGHIVAWEKEDIVEPGKPNAAGFILPTEHNLHRRYPEVAIMIPDTVGRACGGLCVSCQRMYDFQSGHLNFDLDQLKPSEKWSTKLQKLMNYFENDAQLRDILITGGDALMSSNKSMRIILNAVLEMAKRKKEANKQRAEGEKFAEMQRIRLGTRLPVYLPQRIDKELIEILTEFKNEASKIGFKQFVVQTHFETAMEITPEAKTGIEMLLSAGWMVTNQLVFTAAASRRGHTAKLRKALNDVGVVTYYTFSVKGYMENSNNFATNARAVQEQLEEKILGVLPEKYYKELETLPQHATEMVDKLAELREKEQLPFLATDRNVLNLPGVGKSSTFRTIGITPEGRRILEFDHDHNRSHSPIIHEMGKVIIVESKPIADYLCQLESMGEDQTEYEAIWGYSIGETEPRMSFYEYPQQEQQITDKLTNFQI
ncbi:KamA family protein [Prolixibacteraceae bacterium JC049]|nr:KamA family protein [Prolixibacteraceae bacterium JC049]